MAVFGAGVCQWSHNCVSDTAESSLNLKCCGCFFFLIIECLQCLLCLLSHRPGACILLFTVEPSFTKASFFFPRNVFVADESINSTFT